MTTLDVTLEDAKDLAHQHYENFPVAPFFLPKAIRTPIALIYAFARHADDIADEGDDTAEQRLEKLNWMHQQLPDRLPSATKSVFFKNLNKMIESHQLPCQLFHDLLTAFEQDCIKTRYLDFNEVLDYCKRSANPIGRLLLHLTQYDTPKNLMDSDTILKKLKNRHTLYARPVMSRLDWISVFMCALCKKTPEKLT